MGIKLNLKDLPKGPEPIEEGVYYITIQDVIYETTRQGSEGFVFEHKIVGKDTTVKDWMIIYDKDGKAFNFGRTKLYKIIEAAGVDIDEITPEILKKLIVGCTIKAEIRNNENNFPQVHYDNYYSKDDEKHNAKNKPKEEPSETAKEIDTVPDVEDEDEDI